MELEQAARKLHDIQRYVIEEKRLKRKRHGQSLVLLGLMSVVSVNAGRAVVAGSLSYTAQRHLTAPCTPHTNTPHNSHMIITHNTNLHTKDLRIDFVQEGQDDGVWCE